MTVKSAERSPLRIRFATWREAIVYLRSRVVVRGRTLTPDDFARLLERIAKGSVRRWRNWLQGAPDSGLERAQTDKALLEIARLFLEHWPVAVRPRAGEEREHLIARLAAALAALPRDVYPPRAADTLSGASLATLVTRYLADHALRHQDLAERLSARLRTDPHLRDLVDANSRDALVEAWHVQRVACGKGLDVDRAPYYLLVRSFAALSGLDPLQYFALPFGASENSPEYGVFLKIHLPECAAAAANETGAFHALAEKVLARVVRQRVAGSAGKYSEFDATEALAVAQVADAAFELRTRLKPRLELPGSTVYAPMMLAFAEYARQLRLAWSAHEVNIRRLKRGETSCEVRFLVHAGISSRDAEGEWPGGPTGIAFTNEAYYHARATDLRVLWHPANGNGRAGAAPASLANGPGLHAVHAFQSHLYFGEIDAFQQALAHGGRAQRLGEIATANPMDTFFRIELSTSLLQRGRLLDALAVAEGVTAIDARHPTTWAIIALCHANLGRAQCAAEANAIGQLETSASHYQRALSAAALAVEADPCQEDAHVLRGTLHLLRGLDCFRWYDAEFVRGVATAGTAAALVLLRSGFSWALERPAESVADLLYRAAFSDVVQARHHFDRGLDASPTKSRSMFWRLMADALLAVLSGAGGAEVGSPTLLMRATVELGWLSDSSDVAALLEAVQGRIEAYDASLFSEEYHPDPVFAYAVVYWDFIGASDETARIARRHLSRALALASALSQRARDEPGFVVRCHGHLEPATGLIRAIEAALAVVDRWESTGEYVPMHPLYMDPMSRAFPRLVHALSASGLRA